MKTTNNSFQDTIKAYLDRRAQEDSLFAVTYAKKNKNIKDCCSYITGRAKKEQSGGCAVILEITVKEPPIRQSKLTPWKVFV